MTARPDPAGAAVLQQLRRGPRSTAQLMEATGLSRNAVECGIRRARLHGYTIRNAQRLGGHQPGLYWLAHDPLHPARRFCVMPNCGKLLSNSNGTTYCRYHLAQVAYFVGLILLDEVLDDLLGTLRRSDESLSGDAQRRELAPWLRRSVLRFAGPVGRPDWASGSSSGVEPRPGPPMTGREAARPHQPDSRESGRFSDGP